MTQRPFTGHDVISWVFLLTVGAVACLMPAQSDTFWQLRAGKEMVRSGHIMMSDQFSHTAAGAFWPNHQWLGEVVLYAFHRFGGMPLVALACATCAFGSFLTFWFLVRARPEDRLLLAALAMPSVVMGWSLRGQVFSFAGLALTVALVRTGRLWLVPPVLLVWANLHGGVALGFMVLLADALAAAAAASRDLGTRLAVFAVSLGATLVTPLGLRYWPEMLTIMERSRANGVPEWLAPDAAPHFWPFWALAATFVLAAVARYRRLPAHQDRFLCLLGLLLLVLALRTSRNVTPFALVAMAGLSRLFWPSPHAQRKSAAAVTPSRVVGPIVVVSLASALGFVVVRWTWWPPSSWEPMSPQVVAAVRQCPDAILNHYNDGGYLIWYVPERKVFIDSRQDPFPDELAHAFLQAERSSDYSGLIAAHGVRCAVLRPYSRAAEVLRVGAQVRYADQSWVVLSLDRVAEGSSREPVR